ncbi:DUF6215 domain-containing protein [Streptomyces sp. NRRL S-87]|uniref:DUF6215 domain-containing protein n=1 Tax=Streptomyces sp. NRRL S-87 TaxID=1463920 RepID=UPI00068BBEBB|nr:DUF6215 domain-containing protein [Streptomyces sp. NRRL S-87]
MAESRAGRTKQRVNAGAQAVAAVVLVGGLAGGIWHVQGQKRERAEPAPPADCSRSQRGTLPKGYVTGAQLCEALNRQDLPVLLGTPGERAENAYGSEGWVEMAGDQKLAAPEATVQLGTYALKITASYDDMPVAEAAQLLGNGAQVQTVLGHQAVVSTVQATAVSFDLGAGKPETGPGGPARSLLVAGSAKDRGDSFELVIWRRDGKSPDDPALFRVAEKVLPTVPGWTAG